MEHLTFRLCGVEFLDNYVKLTGKDMWQEANGAKLKVHFCLFLDELRKATRTVSKHNLPQERDLNPEPQKKLRDIPKTRP